MQFARTIGRYFGYRRLTFDLDGISLARVLWVSVCPLSVILALVIVVIASYQLDDFVFRDNTRWYEASVIAGIWTRAGVPISIGVAFAAGTQKWSRAAGSWMLLLGSMLVLAGAGFAAASVALVVSAGAEEAFDLKVHIWTEWAYSLTFLAVGYFYVAYRAGLNHRPRRRFVRRRLAAD